MGAKKKKKNSGCLLIVIGVGDSLDLCINQLLVEVGGMEYVLSSSRPASQN